MRVGHFTSFVGFMAKDAANWLTTKSHQLLKPTDEWPLCRHQHIKLYRGIRPLTSEAAFVAQNAMIMGNVVLGHDTCVFYSAVIRNQHTKNRTYIGDNTVVMDRATISGQTTIGRDCVIGVGSTLDCCDVHDNAHIGAGACLALGCIVENGAIVAAGSVVPKDARVPAGEIWAGADNFRKVGVVTDAQASEMNYQVHDGIAAGHAHREAFEAHLEENKVIDHEWLAKKMQRIEEQQKHVHIALPSQAIPVEAQRFLKPRMHARTPGILDHSHGYKLAAPWMPHTGQPIRT